MTSPSNTLYIELHTHSNFSFLDGASRTEELIHRAASLGMPALAITDHDGLYNASAFYKAARKAGIKPIIGAELTLKEGFHLTLLVENHKGYSNLSRLISKAHLAGSKANPVLALSELSGNTDGLICLSGCRKGEIACLLLKDEKEKAYEAGKKYEAIFGRDNFFIEIENHLIPDDKHLSLQLIELTKRLGLDMVATNNVHYATRDRHILHDVLACIKNRVPLDRSGQFRRLNSEYYLKAYDDMIKLPWLPHEAITRTGEIARRCTFDLNFSSSSYPLYPLPAGETATGFLRKLAIQKAAGRYGVLTNDILERIDHEITLIEDKGLSGYFLVVWDIVEYAKRMGISAQGRGSAASSVVAYVLGITPVDPLKHNLFVGRFLNELST
ncbi:MAG TPA: PHP domain-containing protein, partial [Syntrophorhabdaceae bacterium]|nr:PHP domain-containing protein [Syntrophorhabdaceae bacterium]